MAMLQVFPLFLNLWAAGIPLYRRWKMIRANHDRFLLQKRFKEVKLAHAPQALAASLSLESGHDDAFDGVAAQPKEKRYSQS
jgi:hypothetical protein